jgi:hypothetical protein
VTMPPEPGLSQGGRAISKDGLSLCSTPTDLAMRKKVFAPWRCCRASPIAAASDVIGNGRSVRKE